MSANADNVRFILVCNVRVWAFSKNYPFLAKLYFYKKMAYGLGHDISCIKVLVVSDLQALFK